MTGRAAAWPAATSSTCGTATFRARRRPARQRPGRRAGRVPAAQRPPAGTRHLDCTGLLVTPGLVDAQVNGAAGADLTREPGRLADVARALPAYGVTAFLPTVVTSPPGTVERALAAASALRAGPARGRRAGRGADAGGAPARTSSASTRRGRSSRRPPRRTPRRAPARPRPGLVAGWSRDAGLVVATLAPELPGALDVVADLMARGVVVWVGHTEASYEQTVAAVAAGARAVTHLFNAMPPLGHRDPGPVGAVLDGSGGDRPTSSPASSSTGSTCIPPRPHRVGRAGAQPVHARQRHDRRARPARRADRARGPRGPAARRRRPARPDGVTLAGSGVGLDHCVRTLVATTGCPPAEAFVAATRTPADLLRRPDLGRLVPRRPRGTSRCGRRTCTRTPSSSPGVRPGRRRTLLRTHEESRGGRHPARRRCRRAARPDAVESVLRGRARPVLGLATGSSPLATYAELRRRHRRGGAVLRATRRRSCSTSTSACRPGTRSATAPSSTPSSTCASTWTRRACTPPTATRTTSPRPARRTKRRSPRPAVSTSSCSGSGPTATSGFNEPGSSLGSRTRIKTLTARTRGDNARFFGTPDEVPHHVLTQGIGTILEARHLVLLATGTGKADAVAAAVEGPLSACLPGVRASAAPARDGGPRRGGGRAAAARPVLPGGLRGQARVAAPLTDAPPAAPCTTPLPATA